MVWDVWTARPGSWIPNAGGMGLASLIAHEPRMQDRGSPKGTQGAVARRETSFLQLAYFYKVPTMCQGCSETAKEQSAKLVHQLQKLEGDVTKKEEGKRRRRNRRRKNRRQRAEIYPLQKESEKGWVYV